MNFPLLCNINLKIETKKRTYGKSHLTLASRKVSVQKEPGAALLGGLFIVLSFLANL